MRLMPGVAVCPYLMRMIASGTDSILSVVSRDVSYRRAECMVLISVISGCRQIGVA
jgi:hypothetical protein